MSTLPDAPLFDRDFVVLEFANILAGPITGMFFAELGARVIKVENPHTGGDPTRGWKVAAEQTTHDISSYFACANWGKESIALDLMTTAGQRIAQDLIAHADLVLTAFKPGDDARMGLDAATLRARRPELIVASISAYGPEDPRPGFDAILQAESGFTYLNGEPDGPPTKMPVALVDLLLAHHLKEALLLAIMRRDRTGVGSTIDTALLDSAIASLANQATNFLQAGVVPTRLGSEHPNIVPYGTILTCADGREVVIAAATERQFRALVTAIGRPDLADDPRYATGQDRVRQRDALLSEIRVQAAELTADAFAAAMLAAKVPFGWVNDMAQVFDLPGVASRLVLTGVADGDPISGVRSFPVRVTPPGILPGADGRPTTWQPTAPPHLNQHGAELLAGLLGYDADTVASHAQAGAFGAR